MVSFYSSFFLGTCLMVFINCVRSFCFTLILFVLISIIYNIFIFTVLIFKIDFSCFVLINIFKWWMTVVMLFLYKNIGKLVIFSYKPNAGNIFFSFLFFFFFFFFWEKKLANIEKQVLFSEKVFSWKKSTKNSLCQTMMPYAKFGPHVITKQTTFKIQLHNYQLRWLACTVKETPKLTIAMNHPTLTFPNPAFILQNLHIQPHHICT